MKVFVYSKKNSKKITEIKDVVSVHHHDDNIVFVSSDGIEFEFDTHLVKTTSFQN